MEKSHLLGEFLVKNKVVTADQMLQAISEQKHKAHNLSLMSQLTNLISKDDIERVAIRQMEKNDTLENVIMDMGLLSESELDALPIDEKAYRIPLGQVLLKHGFVDEKHLDIWLHKFENQEFDDKEVLELLKSIPLFSDLDEKYLKSLYDSMKHKYYAAGDIIYKEDTDSNLLYIIESGLVRLTVNSGAHQMELCSLQSGDYFGFHGLLSDEPRTERATAIMNTTVWRLPRESLTPILLENPELAIAAAKELSDEMQGVLKGVHKKASRIDTGNIHVIIFESDVDPDGKIAANLLAEIFEESDGDSLLIYSINSPIWPNHPKNRLEDIEKLDLDRIISDGDKSVYGLNLPGIENEQGIDKLSLWLNEQSDKYKHVFFLVTPGYIEFRRLTMGVCRRSVALVRRKIPEFLKYMVPKRDRVYLVDSNNEPEDLERYRVLMELMKENQVCLAPHTLKLDDIKAASGLLSRYLYGKSIGIALGGGGARGMAHIGILKILHDEGFMIDAVSGASAGAIVASQYAYGFDPHAIEDYFLNNVTNDKKHPFSDYRIPYKTGAIAKGKKARKMLMKAFGNDHCIQTRLGFFPVATNMLTGKEFVVRDTTIWNAILASGAGPGLLPLVALEGAVLADGALVNNVPASVLKDYGCDFVISSNISIDPVKSQAVNAKSIMNVLMHSLDILMFNQLKEHMDYTDVELQPAVDKYGILDFNRGDEIMKIGEDTVTSRLGELKRLVQKSGIKLHPKIKV